MSEICVICDLNEEARVPATHVCGYLQKPLCARHASFCAEDGHASRAIGTEAASAEAQTDGQKTEDGL